MELIEHYMSQFNESCQLQMLEHPHPTDGIYCPTVFDGLTCFNYTKAGTFASSPCPGIYETVNNAGEVRTFCEANGTWRLNPQTKKQLIDSSQCFHRNGTEGDHHSGHIYVFIAGAIPSLVLLFLSLVIFHVFRQLRCDRITVHKNLFVSFFMTTLSWVIVYRFVNLEHEVVIENPVWCQVLHLVSYYFTAANFTWMFCEGIYLHFILVRALRTGKLLIKCLIAFGWGFPLIIIITYGAARGSYPERTRLCWGIEDMLLNIISIPIYVTTAVNICLLINIIWLLLTKLRQIPDANQSRKAAKAILILVPLFGLQFLLFPFRPEHDTISLKIYEYFMSIMTSLQGTMVSIIFCFCNGEVRSLIRRKWQERRIMSDHRRKHNGNTSSTFIDGYSMVDTTRDVTSNRSKYDHQTKVTETLELRNSTQVFTPLVDRNGDVIVRNADVEDA